MTILQDDVDTLNRQENVNPVDPAIYAYDFLPAMLTRLQREQAWTPTFTRLAVDEYRRFVQLAVTAPHPVTPSRAVLRITARS